MECWAGCGNKKAWAVHKKVEKHSGREYTECNVCFDPSIPKNPDVYFRQPYWDYNLHDKDDASYDVNKGTFVRSKEHKAYLLKKLNLQEAGDKESGSRIFDKKSSQNNWHQF